MSSQLIAGVFAVSSQIQNHNIFLFVWDSFHISVVLVAKEIHFFWGSYCNPLCWQWQPAMLTLISPLVYAKVIKENAKLDLSLKNSSSRAPCCL